MLLATAFKLAFSLSVLAFAYGQGFEELIAEVGATVCHCSGCEK